jgi:DNA-binding LacI/PurR family transcriptional regulator
MTTSRLNSIADLAALAGVSKSTVSRALDDSPLISPETKERIRALAQEHGFHRNTAARGLSLKQSHVVGLLTHPYKKMEPLTDGFTHELMSGIAAGVQEHGYDLLLIQATERDTAWISRYLHSGRVDGFILMGSALTPEQLDLLETVRAPLALWGAPPGPHAFSTVIGDNLTGGRVAAEHLVQRGRRRIGFIGGPRRQPEIRDRYRGYEAALGAAGIAVDPELSEYTDWSPSGAARATAALLERAPDLDGIFAAGGDLVAISALEELRKQGRRVPDDVAVIGYDDISLASFTSPPLTTVSQNVFVAGRLLAQSVIQQLREGTVSNTSIPAELVVRSST